MSTVDNLSERLEFLQGTLEVLILRSLTLGPNHAYGISQFLKQESNQEFLVDNGSLYPALQRLLQREWIVSQWKTSPNARRAGTTGSRRRAAGSWLSQPRSGSGSSRRWAGCSPPHGDHNAGMAGQAPRVRHARSPRRGSARRARCALRHGSARPMCDRGMGRAAALDRARRQFGNRTIIQEASREAWMFNRLEALLHDLRYGLRLLRRSPGFALTAVSVIALGIGASTAAFTLLDHVLLRPLPFAEPRSAGDAVRASRPTASRAPRRPRRTSSTGAR